MVLRSIIASAAAILIAFDQSVVASSGLNLRHASSAATVDAGAKKVSNSAGRSLEGVDLTQCYEDMVAVANKHNILTKDAYFYFSDIMSNQWFSDNGINDYTELPYDMKFAFVTLSCECISLGGGDDCCQNHRANLNVDGADGQDVSQAQTNYLNDICTLTYNTIGSDRRNPKPGDMPTTAQPTPPTSPPPTPTPQPVAPTPPPTKKFDPIITPPTPAPRPVGPPGGIGPGGAVGLSLAAAAILALLIFLIAGRKDEEEKDEEENLDDIEADDMRKVDVNANLEECAPDSEDSPDGTKSMTNSVFSEQSTIATAVTTTANYNTNTNMLPGMEDSSENESSIYTDDEENTYDQPIEIPCDTSSLSSCSQEASYTYNSNNNSSALPPVKQSGDDDDDIHDDSLDYAIENGNWEQVAASAAALVQKEM